MGWAFGRGRHPRTGRPRDIGYGVAATCDEPKCKERIDRGLAFYCGDELSHEGGGDWGCGGYYCGEHLYMALCEADDRDDENPRIVRGSFCSRCLKDIEDEHVKDCPQCRWAQESAVLVSARTDGKGSSDV